MAKKTVSDLFPIMDGPAIPWKLIEPHDAQARRNHSQSLVELARRGGLAPSEACAVLEDRKWRRMDETEALARLKYLTGWLTPEEANTLREQLAQAEAQKEEALMKGAKLLAEAFEIGRERDRLRAMLTKEERLASIETRIAALECKINS